MTSREASEPIYGTKVLFLFGGDPAESSRAAREWMAKVSGEDIGEDLSDARGRTFTSGKGHCAIWIKAPDDQRALVHEIIHAGIYAMTHIGHAITEQSDEPFAYYCDWLFGEATAS